MSPKEPFTACAIQIPQKPTQRSFHPGPNSTMGQGGFHLCETNMFDQAGQFTAMRKIGFILAKMKKSLAQLALKPFLHNTFIQDTKTWILGELNCH